MRPTGLINRLLGEKMNSMKFSAIALALGVTAGIQQFDAALGVAKSLYYEPNSIEYSQFSDGGFPIVVNGFPKVSKESDNLGLKIFRCGFAHYNYKITTLFIVAFDSNAAKLLARNFHSQINQQANLEYPENENFKQHFFEDDISPDEVLSVGKNAEAVYTIFVAKA
jgi:hypothetical protein